MTKVHGYTAGVWSIAVEKCQKFCFCTNKFSVVTNCLSLLFVPLLLPADTRQFHLFSSCNAQIGFCHKHPPQLAIPQDEVCDTIYPCPPTPNHTTENQTRCTVIPIAFFLAKIAALSEERNPSIFLKSHWKFTKLDSCFCCLKMWLKNWEACFRLTLSFHSFALYAWAPHCPIFFK